MRSHRPRQPDAPGMAALHRAILVSCCYFGFSPVGAIDGQSNRASEEEMNRVFNDPNCEWTRGSTHGVDWDEVRRALHRMPFPESVPTIQRVVKRLERPVDLDREAALCPFGVVAVLFFFVKFLVEGAAAKFDIARIYFSLLDMYHSGAHPHLLNGADWLVKDSRVTALRRAILSRLPQPGIAERPRIFVYREKDIPELGELIQGASFCAKGQWGMEVHIHEWILASKHLTLDPAEADFFFVPGYSICMFEAGFIPLPALDESYKRLVRKLPYFSRHQGRDHIFTFGSGMSVNLFRSWQEDIPRSIFLTPETWLFNDFAHITTPCFDTWKDVVIPGYLHKHEVLSLVGASKPMERRERFAVFLGRTDPSRGPHPATGGADVRSALRQWHIEGKIFVAQNLSLPDMHAVMGNAKFCFVPKGKSAWSLRFYEALFAGCVPVVLSDNWELPFEDFIDLPSFVIKWPMTSVDDRLLKHLRSQSDDVVTKYMLRGQQLRCWYLYPPALHEIHGDPSNSELYKVCPKMNEENAFAGILRQLQSKQRVSRTAGRFFEPPRKL